MKTVAQPTIDPAQQRRCERLGLSQSVDVHCHCLPGLDDGPVSWQEAMALCRLLVDDGVTTVIATPHQLGPYDRRNSSATIRETVKQLSALLEAEQIPLDVLPGADVRIDERLLQLLEADEILTAADAGRHVLLELPDGPFVDPLPMIRGLSGRGIQAIITHPERHTFLHRSTRRICGWIAEGAGLQVTAASLAGDFGRDAMDAGWRFVMAGWVSLIATDAHGTTWRPPRLTQALDALEQQCGYEVAKLICGVNPLKILHGQQIHPPGLS
jgi:protein-tyrosine phosphatase